jgi:hypothetical protein
MPLDAEGPEDGAEGQAKVEKHGALLDVKLDVGGGVLQPAGRIFSPPFSKSMPISRKASGSRKRRPGRAEPAGLVHVQRAREQAEEPKRLLPKRAPSSSAQSTRRTVTGGLARHIARIDPAQDLHAGQDVEAAIEPSSVRDRVQMSAHEQRLGRWRRAASTRGCPPSSDMRFDGKRRRASSFKPGSRGLPRLRERHSLGPVLIRCQAPELLQLGHCAASGQESACIFESRSR